eukprot:jgi/Mesvir1/16630/Mv10164-RA.1
MTRGRGGLSAKTCGGVTRGGGRCGRRVGLGRDGRCASHGGGAKRAGAPGGGHSMRAGKKELGVGYKPIYPDIYVPMNARGRAAKKRVAVARRAVPQTEGHMVASKKRGGVRKKAAAAARAAAVRPPPVAIMASSSDDDSDLDVGYKPMYTGKSMYIGKSMYTPMYTGGRGRRPPAPHAHKRASASATAALMAEIDWAISNEERRKRRETQRRKIAARR